MTSLRPLTPLLIASLSLGTAACEDETPPPRTPVEARADASPAARVRLEPIEEDEAPGAIRVDMEIAKLCKLPDAYFPFDSSKITGAAADTLRRLADCVTSGELQGRALEVVGHADPRGTDTYNMALGHRRAGSVADFLMASGMSRSNLETTSMGEIKADGDDPVSWAMDRRVDIHLVPEGDRRDQGPYSSLDE